MVEHRPFLTFLSHAVLILIVLTVVQFRFIERKVQY